MQFDNFFEILCVLVHPTNLILNKLQMFHETYSKDGENGVDDNVRPHVTISCEKHSEVADFEVGCFRCIVEKAEEGD